MSSKGKFLLFKNAAKVGFSDLDAKRFLLEAPRGAYTTCRTINNGRNIVEYQSHVERLARSLTLMYRRDHGEISSSDNDGIEAVSSGANDENQYEAAFQPQILQPLIEYNLKNAMKEFMDELGSSPSESSSGLNQSSLLLEKNNNTDTAAEMRITILIEMKENGQVEENGEVGESADVEEVVKEEDGGVQDEQEGQGAVKESSEEKIEEKKEEEEDKSEGKENEEKESVVVSDESSMSSFSRNIHVHVAALPAVPQQPVLE
eukprot:TRINITY_DN4280_c0_g1_i1.p1 TRINITY_DN4280_c0_g1~~TRINITY_DN4280_c0_g1_i1.p1  ORF type:complete len:286 (+),score=95.75 TRINITY_DN4280_c0_g1_i1:76-858(+)